MAEGEEARLVRMLSDFDMQDDAADLAKYGIRRPGDLAYLDEDLINDLPVTPICKAKLRRLAKSIAAVDDRPRTSVDAHALASAQNTGFHGPHHGTTRSCTTCDRASSHAPT